MKIDGQLRLYPYFTARLVFLQARLYIIIVIIIIIYYYNYCGLSVHLLHTTSKRFLYADLTVTSFCFYY